MKNRADLHLAMRERRSTQAMYPSTAIREAFERHAGMWQMRQSNHDLEVCCGLWEIIEQMGCEHIDGDGSLTDLIDILIRG